MSPPMTIRDQALLGSAQPSGGGGETSPYTEDFDTYATQAAANAQWVPETDTAPNRVDISSEYLQCYNPAVSSGNKNIIKDLGTIVSDSSDWTFVLKFKLYIDAWNASVNYSCSGMFGLWSKDGAARNIRGGYSADDNENGIVMGMMAQSAAQRYTVRVDNDTHDWDGGSNFGVTPGTGQTQYCTIERTAEEACSFRLTTSSDYSGGVLISKDGSSGCDSDCTDLQYLGFKNGQLDSSSPYFSVRYDDIHLTW